MELKWNDDGLEFKGVDWKETDGVWTPKNTNAKQDNSHRQRRIDILDLAKGVIVNDRNKTYGEPENIFPLIAEYWSTYLRESQHDADIYISDTDVAMMMALMKIARIMENPGHTDSYVDAIGYLAIAQTLE